MFDKYHKRASKTDDGVEMSQMRIEGPGDKRMKIEELAGNDLILSYFISHMDSKSNSVTVHPRTDFCNRLNTSQCPTASK